MSTTNPSVEDTIKQAADENDDQEQEEEHEADVSDPSRYWFASTLCPLLAGTFGPMASGFSICALVENWRVYIPDGAVEEHANNIPDPQWLIAINAISLAAAVVGNAALLLNMALRLRFSIAQPITIGGFYLAGLLLIVDMAALTSSNVYRIDDPEAQPAEHHALTSAFYYAIFAAALYFIIASLMCVTVWGANKGYYEKNFRLTNSQRTLMLQTMSLIAYILVGALIFCNIEQWEYLDAVYWADVTLLTIGLGDYVPKSDLGQGLMFPYAIGGIVTLGLVVGSIRTLVLERGKEKLAARITEKKRDSAVNHIDVKNQTIRIGIFAKARFVVRPDMLPAQRREEEFRVMRSVQSMAEQQRRYIALATSAFFALALWFVGAAIFQVTERDQGWTYLESLFFAYTSLLTIGYGTPYPQSNSGKPFFVFWSLLAIPSLTILISNMGDTVVKWISDLTDWVGSITVLPGEHGVRATLKLFIKRFRPMDWYSGFSGPGIFGDIPSDRTDDGVLKMSDFEKRMFDRMADRASAHLTKEELHQKEDDDSDSKESSASDLDSDIAFYHYILARECRDVMKDLSASPPKQYTWADWEYYIKLMGSSVKEALPHCFPNKADMDDAARPFVVDMNKTEKAVELNKELEPKVHAQDHQNKNSIRAEYTWRMPWTWLSNESPLMSSKTESEWILERLTAALERELNNGRKGLKKKPPVSFRELRQHAKEKGGQENDEEQVEHRALERAADNQ